MKKTLDEIIEFLKSKKIEKYQYFTGKESIGGHPFVDYLELTVPYTSAKLKQCLIDYGFEIINKRFPTESSWIDGRYETILRIKYTKCEK